MAHNCPTCGTVQMTAAEALDLQIADSKLMNKYLKSLKISRDTRKNFLEGYRMGWNRLTRYMKQSV